MSKVGLLGGGSFGTALGIMLAKKGHYVKIWDRNKDTVENINIRKINIKYLPSNMIPSNVIATTDLKEVITDSEIIIFAIPSHIVRDISKKIKGLVKKDQIIVNVAKGIEEKTSMRLSQVIKEELPWSPVVVLSGPSHAEEVANDLPTTMVVTSELMEYAKVVQDIFMTSNLRVYTNDDIIGVEIGGAVKNIIALATGISDGIGYGDNTKAAIMTRGMSEIIKIGTSLGGKKETFYGLTGMGDLIVTCTSMHSRNRRAGILIGKGLSSKEACSEVGMIVEGIKACEAFYHVKEKLNVSMPITDVLYKVIFEDKDPKAGVYELMSREKKDECN